MSRFKVGVNSKSICTSIFYRVLRLSSHHYRYWLNMSYLKQDIFWVCWFWIFETNQKTKHILQLMDLKCSTSYFLLSLWFGINVRAKLYSCMQCKNFFLMFNSTFRSIQAGITTDLPRDHTCRYKMIKITRIYTRIVVIGLSLSIES